MIPLRWKRLSMVFPASHSLVPTESPFERIADEVLLKIFSFLTYPSCAGSPPSTRGSRHWPGTQVFGKRKSANARASCKS